MPIKVQCVCGKAFAAKDELAGKTVKCPGCQKPLKIPGGAPAPGKAPAKPTAARPATAGPAAKQPAKAAAKPAPAAPAASPKGAADLFDEIGLQAAAPDTQPCPGCSQPMPLTAVICIKCGYNTRIGRRMETVKVGMEGAGEGGHGAVAQDLLNKAAAVIDEDAAAEAKKTTEGVPWWVFLIGLVILICLAAFMLMFWGKEKPSEDGKKGFLQPASRGAGLVQYDAPFAIVRSA